MSDFWQGVIGNLVANFLWIVLIAILGWIFNRRIRAAIMGYLNSCKNFIKELDEKSRNA